MKGPVSPRVGRVTRGAARRRPRALLVAVLAATFGVVFLYVWLYAHVLAESSELDAVRRRCDVLENRAHLLVGEATQLSSLTRIGPIAERELGLIRADGASVRRLVYVEDGPRRVARGEPRMERRLDLGLLTNQGRNGSDQAHE